MDKHDGKRSLSNFKQSAASTSVASTSASISPANRHRFSVTTENQPKLTDLRKILHPEEERRDLETVCKSFWDSFIDCQCIECTFNNAAKFITAFILFLTVALIINTITVSGSTGKLKLDRNVSVGLNLTVVANSTGNSVALHKLEPKVRFLNRPHALRFETSVSQLNQRLERSLREDLKRFDRIKKLIELKNDLKSKPTTSKRPKVNRPVFLKNSSPLFPHRSKFDHHNPNIKSLKIKQAPSR